MAKNSSRNRRTVQNKELTKDADKHYPDADSAQDAIFAKPLSVLSSFKTMGVADKISWGAYLLAILLVPLATSNLSMFSFGTTLFSMPFTYDQFDAVKVFLLRACTLVSLGGWLVSFFVQNKKFRFSPVLFLVLAFLVWVGISAAFADHVPTAIFGKYRRFEGFITFVNYAVLFFLGLQYIDSHERVCVIAKVFFFSIFIVSLYGVMQYVNLDPAAWGSLPFEPNRAFSTYGNPDLLGGALVLAAPLSATLALTERNIIWRIVYWAGFLLNIVCLICSFVRGAWIAMLVALALLVIVAIIQRSKLSIVNIVDAGFAILTGIFGAVVGLKSLSNASEVMNIAKRFASIFDTSSGSGLTRLQIWDAAFAAIKDRPLLGHGADTFRLLFPKYKPVEYVAAAGYKSVADNVHNYILQLATGVGIVGVVLMYGVFIWVAIVSGKDVFTRKNGKKNRSRALLLGGFWIACAAYLIHLFFGLSVVGCTFFLWIALAALLVDKAKTYQFKSAPWKAAVAAILVAGCAIGLFFNIQFIRADQAFLQSKVYAGSGDYESAANEAEYAVALNPYNDIYRAEVGLDYMKEGYAYASSDPTTAKTALLKAESSIQETIAYCPLEYDNYVFLTGLYNNMAKLPGLSATEQSDYQQKAIDAGLAAIKVEKYGPLARLQLAQAYEAVGEIDKARKEATYALEMDPNFSSATEFLQELESKEASLPA